MKASLTVQLHLIDGNSVQKCDAIRVLPGTQWSRDLGPLSGLFRWRKPFGLSQWACWPHLLTITQRLAVQEGELWALGTILTSSKLGSSCSTLKDSPSMSSPNPAYSRKPSLIFAAPNEYPLLHALWRWHSILGSIHGQPQVLGQPGVSLPMTSESTKSRMLEGTGALESTQQCLDRLQGQTTLNLHCTWPPRDSLEI